MSTAAQLLKLYSDGVIDAEALNVGLKSLPSADAAQPAPSAPALARAPPPAPLQGSARARKRARQKANKQAKLRTAKLRPEDHTSVAGGRLRLKRTPTKKSIDTT